MEGLIKSKPIKNNAGMTWEVVNINTICRPRQWKTLSMEKLSSEGYPVYGANGKIGFYTEFTHEYPTLAITCRGATCGSVHITEPKSYVNGNAMALDNLSAKINIRFLYYYFLQRGFNDVISGSAQPQITGEGLSKVKIPLPPLPIQKRIAEILDAADALKRKDQQLLKKYDELAQAIFIDMFGDPVKNEKRWELIAYSDLFHTRLGKMLDAKKQIGNKKFKYLGNSNVQWFKFKLDNLAEMEFNESDINTFNLKKGDILICEGGEVGRAAIWNEEINNVFFQKAIHRARIKSNNITPEFMVMVLWFYSKFGGFKDFVSTSTISHLTGEKLKTILIPLPPYSKQVQYTRTIKSINMQGNTLEVSLNQSIALFNTLIQKAFTGELVS